MSLDDKRILIDKFVGLCLLNAYAVPVSVWSKQVNNYFKFPVDSAFCYSSLSFVLCVLMRLKIKPCSYVPTGYNFYKQNGLLGGYFDYGSLVFFDFDGDGVPEHVGIALFRNFDVLVTLEFNSSNGFKVYNGIKIRHIKDVLGFGRWFDLV